MTYLLDVNLLVALLDIDHAQNTAARVWFEALEEPWATCPITEMGVARVLSLPVYPKGMATPGEVVRELKELQKLGQHEFWNDDLSLVDSAVFRPEQMRQPKQITDTYLLALATAHGGRLATFDRRLDAATVQGGQEALYLLTP